MAVAPTIRTAHPIQLSAERLQLKLESKLVPGRQLLNRSVDTMSPSAGTQSADQPGSGLCHLPTAKLVPLDLANHLSDVLFAARHILKQRAAELSPGLPGSRQACHLAAPSGSQPKVQNALDAVMSTPWYAQVLLKTDTPLNDDGGVRAVRLLVRITGPAGQNTQRAFEPYITTKAQRHGSGPGRCEKLPMNMALDSPSVNLNRPSDADFLGESLWGGGFKRGSSFVIIFKAVIPTASSCVKLAVRPSRRGYLIHAHHSLLTTNWALVPWLSEILSDEGHTVEVAESKAPSLAGCKIDLDIAGHLDA